jgi:hypothetical protein
MPSASTLTCCSASSAAKTTALLDHGACFSFFLSQATLLDYSALSSGLEALSKKASDAGLRGMHSACDLLLDKMDDARHRLTVPGHLLAHLNVEHIISVGPGLMAPFALPDLALQPEDFAELVRNQPAAQAVQVLPTPLNQRSLCSGDRRVWRA